jgi:hypothetical protein
MKVKILVFALAAVFLCCSSALADTLVSSGTWPAVPTPNNVSPPFWDNPSLDGGLKNAGYILTKTNDPISGYTNQDWLGYSNGTAQYLSAQDGTGNPTGGVVNDVYFTNSLVGGQGAYLIIEVAGYASSNVFGIYNLSNPGDQTEIFNGPGSQGANWAGGVPNTYTNYGFYLTTPEGKTFYSDVDGLTDPDSNSNFAFFRNTSQPNILYIAMEDLRDPIGTECLGDYNDMIVQVTFGNFSNAPVPPTMLLFGSGMLGLLGLGWRRKNS